MSENETAIGDTASAEPAVDKNEQAQTAAGPDENSVSASVSLEEISYHAVEKDGVVTAIWEMQGRKHMRTIDPRSRQGQDILRLYTTEHAEHHEAAHPGSS